MKHRLPPCLFPPRRHRSALGVFGLAAVMSFATALRADERSAYRLADLSIEELLNESVTSVAKKETKLSQSAAAIAVIMPDDIRRLGITTIPEALRLVPGMDVARITANEWAVSARGFNNQFATKLLVLVDGRTVYTPASAGVFWNAQDVVLDDLDRIEVIRGPGSTLWGANAVNGVINITTKSAKETQGGLVSLASGTEDQPAATVRYGGKLAPDLYYRVYVKTFDRKRFVDSSGNPTPDDWRSSRGGFRLDWQPPTADSLTLQGDFYRSEAGKRVSQISFAPPDTRPFDAVEQNSGTNVIGRWTRTISSTSALTVQAYYDRVKQGDGYGLEYRDTLDFDLQHRLAIGERHDLVWGAGYRDTQIRNTSSLGLTWTPEHHWLPLFNVFAQDDVMLVRDRLYLTLGSKVEHHRFTGREIQPSARLRWTPTDRQTVWAAVSRADRIPAIFERNGRLNLTVFQPGPTSPPMEVSLLGNPALSDEELDAFEIGYRIEANAQLSFDLSSFYNRYHDLTAVVPGPAQFETNPMPPHLVVPLSWQNALEGETLGAELSAQWQVTDHWRMVGSYTALRMRVRPDPTEEGKSPRGQFQLRSYLNLSHDVELNAAVFSVERIETQSGTTHAVIPAYLRCDLGVVWRPMSAVELGIWGQNLTKRRHAEFASQATSLLTEVPRTIAIRGTWRF